jgi:hypothetical protein
MAINRHSILVSGFGDGFGLVHTALAVVLGGFAVFQDVSGSLANDHGIHFMVGDCAGAIVAKGWRPSRW